jgi:hypothetical protein
MRAERLDLRGRKNSAENSKKRQKPCQVKNASFFIFFTFFIVVNGYQFSRMNEEFSKRDALWATLLEKIYGIEKQIYEIKLDQSKSHSKA